MQARKRLKRFIVLEVLAVIVCLAVSYGADAMGWGSFKDWLTLSLSVCTIIIGIFSMMWTEESGEAAERRAACRELAKAASAYYGALAELQAGQWNESEVQAAEKRMNEAEGLTTCLTAAEQEDWYTFKQHGINITDYVNKHVHESEARKTYWASQITELTFELDKVKAFSKS